MRCVQYERFGDESVLQVRDAPVPPPAASEVQVRVSFASLNPVDFKLRAGLLRLLGKPERPAITGKDFAGTVSALGMSASGFRPGQRVFGSVNAMGGAGACAEYVALGTDLLAPIPDAVSDEVAACLPVASGTAYQALMTQARLRAGQSVLVTGASGGVGSGAVQIARSLGARVAGVCSTANVEYVRSLGADPVFDYRSQDWRTAGALYDVILDAAGSSSFSAARAHLAPAGWYINTYPPASLMIAAPFLRVFSRQRAVPFMLKTTAAQLGELARLADAGVLRPRIARTIALEDVAAAQRDMKDGKVSGKVCVRVAA